MEKKKQRCHSRSSTIKSPWAPFRLISRVGAQESSPPAPRRLLLPLPGAGLLLSAPPADVPSSCSPCSWSQLQCPALLPSPPAPMAPSTRLLCGPVTGNELLNLLCSLTIYCSSGHWSSVIPSSLPQPSEMKFLGSGDHMGLPGHQKGCQTNRGLISPL